MGLIGSGEKALASIEDIPAIELLETTISWNTTDKLVYMNGMPHCLDEFPDVKSYIVRTLLEARKPMSLMDIADRCARIQSLINILIDLCKIDIAGDIPFYGAYVGKVHIGHGTIIALIMAEANMQIEVPVDAELRTQDIHIDLPPKECYPDHGLNMNPVMSGSGIILHKAKMNVDCIQHITTLNIRLSSRWREGN